MSLTNADIRAQLQQLLETVQRAGGDLTRSDDLPAMDLALVTVELDKISTKAGKLADRIAKLSAPLFGEHSGENGAVPDGKPGKKRRAST